MNNEAKDESPLVVPPFIPDEEDIVNVEQINLE